MADALADDLLRSGYDRWTRLEEAKAIVAEDLKELFAELKASGFDGKALRAAFRHVAKMDDLASQEHEAVVDLYVASLTGARPAHAHVEPIVKSAVSSTAADAGEAPDAASPATQSTAARKDVRGGKEEQAAPDTGQSAKRSATLVTLPEGDTVGAGPVLASGYQAPPVDTLLTSARAGKGEGAVATRALPTHQVASA